MVKFNMLIAHRIAKMSHCGGLVYLEELGALSGRSLLQDVQCFISTNHEQSPDLMGFPVM